MNNDFGISQRSYHLIIQAFIEFPEIEETVIFGSRAVGNYRRGSDIDIAIFGKKVTAQTAMNLSGKLNESLPIPYKVDVVAPEHVDHPELIDHIKRVGISIYKKTNS